MVDKLKSLFRQSAGLVLFGASLVFGLNRVDAIVNEYGMAQYTFTGFELGIVRRFFIGTFLDVFFDMDSLSKDFYLSVSRLIVIIFFIVLGVVFLLVDRAGKIVLILAASSIITPVGVSLYGFPDLIGHAFLISACLLAYYRGKVGLILSVIFYLLAASSSEISIISGGLLYLIVLLCRHGFIISITLFGLLNLVLVYLIMFRDNYQIIGNQAEKRAIRVFGLMGEYAYSSLPGGFKSHFNMYKGGSHHGEYLFREVGLWIGICTLGLLFTVIVVREHLSKFELYLIPLTTTTPFILSYLGNDWSRWQFTVGLNFVLSILYIIFKVPKERKIYVLALFFALLVLLELLSSNQSLYEFEKYKSVLENLMSLF